MKRRNFLKNSILTAGSISILDNLTANLKSPSLNPSHSFNLKYAPHIGMFKHSAGDDILDQLHFMADQGFTAFEDNEMSSRDISTQKAMTKVMESRGMEMGVFVAHKIYWQKPNLSSGDKKHRQEFLDYIKKSIDIAQRVKAKWMTVVPGHVSMNMKSEYQTAHMIESLKQAAEILEPHNLVMVLEPLNFFNHPGQFLTEIPQAHLICKAIDSPSCKILFDIYHQQISEGNIIPNIDMAWDEIAYFQVGDTPGRNEPTTGEINYKNIFKHLHTKGYKGIIGMEHGNSQAGEKGETAVINAYKLVDSFV